MQNDPAAEPALDRYRDAVASLHLNGTHVGYLATKVERMRGGLLFRRQERVWLLLTRLDGSRDPLHEDYAPWTSIVSLEEGCLDWASPDGDRCYQVHWLEGDEGSDSWGRYGIIGNVGAYLGGSR